MSARNTTKIRPLNLEHPAHNPIEHDIVTITPDMAELWLGVNHGNRNQRERAIAAYSRDILSGAWLVTGESIKFDWDGKLIDGQHRLEAVIETKTPITTLVVRNLDPRVQGVLDTNAKRTAADALRFAGVDVNQKDIAAIARVAVAYETGALRTALDVVAGNILTNTEAVEWHHKNPDVEQAVAFTKRIVRPIGGTTAGLGYAALVLLRIDAQAAIEFLSSAAELRTNGNGDPRKALLDAFSKIRADRRTPTAAETLSIVFRSWNAWRSNKNLSIIRATASSTTGSVAVQIPEVAA